MIKLLANNAPWFSGVEFLAQDILGESRGIGKHIVFEIPKENIVTEPTFILSREETQNLMDNLWQCGFRPTEGMGSSGQLKAIQDHLADMRRLVFQFLEKEKNEVLHNRA